MEKAHRSRERAPPHKPVTLEVAFGPYPSPKENAVAASAAWGPWSHLNADSHPPYSLCNTNPKSEPNRPEKRSQLGTRAVLDAPPDLPIPMDHHVRFIQV